MERMPSLTEAQRAQSTAETAVATKRNEVTVAPALCAGAGEEVLNTKSAKDAKAKNRRTGSLLWESSWGAAGLGELSDLGVQEIRSG
jgi:hypothetical protein